MKCRDILKMEHPESVSDEFSGGCEGCPMDYGYLPKPEYCLRSDDMTRGEKCKLCWDRDIPENKLPIYPIEEETYEPHIKDSGDRTQFETGAVRDMREGKGRCDLLPLEVVSRFIGDDGFDPVLRHIAEFQETNDTAHLYNALAYFDERHWDNCYTMILEVAKHFEEGAKKYGENNWQKGIPVHCYIDSAVRHYLKWLRGDKDEPHDRAFVWNLMCCIWEVDYHKEETDG